MPLPNTWNPGDTGWPTSPNLIAQANAINFYSNVNIVTTGLTLDTSAQQWVYTGTAAATWTLPPISGNTGLTYTLYNRSTTAAALITVAASGSDLFYSKNTTQASYLIAPGGYLQIINDGTYWFVLLGRTVAQLTGVVYSQSDVYGSINPADYTGMNCGFADATKNNNETGCGTTPTYIRADCGSVKYIDHIVMGYNYLNNLPGGWQTTTYQENVPVQGSSDGSTWTTILNTPTYASTGSSNGLVPLHIGGSWRYIQLTWNNYLCMLQFQIWGA